MKRKPGYSMRVEKRQKVASFSLSWNVHFRWLKTVRFHQWLWKHCKYWFRIYKKFKWVGDLQIQGLQIKRIDCTTRTYWWNSRAFASEQIRISNRLGWPCSQHKSDFRVHSLLCTKLLSGKRSLSLSWNPSHKKMLLATSCLLVGIGVVNFSQRNKTGLLWQDAKAGRSFRLGCQLGEVSHCLPKVYDSKVASAKFQWTHVRHLCLYEEDFTWWSYKTILSR